MTPFLDIRVFIIFAILIFLAGTPCHAQQAREVNSVPITGSQTAVIFTEGCATVNIDVTGTWTGTLQFKELVGVTWLTVGSTTSNEDVTLPVAPFDQFEVVGATVATGTAVVCLESSPATNGTLGALNNYEFVSLSSSTITGYFVNNSGRQISAAVSYAITTTPVSFATIAGGSIPIGATGFVGTLTGSNLYVGRAGTSYTPAAGYPQIAATTNLVIGQAI